ncbi:MAG: hypothetical protein U9R01_01780 [candidate division WOR-3 bacterium]|nr:hypothetical protein [candidate division WOR-3 bacterium]
MNIRRRIIYLLVAIVVTIPLVIKITMPVRVSPPVQLAYDKIEELKHGSVVLLSTDYEAGTMPELYPMTTAVLRHLFSKDIKVLLMSVYALGVPIGAMALDEVASEYNKEYGTDYVILGFKPGVDVVIVAIGEEIRDAFPTDYAGTPLDALPMMEGIHNYNDISIMVDLCSGSTLERWIMFAQARFKQRLIAGCTAVMATSFYPYLNAGQIEGLIGGLKGAAEYEKLIGSPGVATSGMPAQSFMHVLILVLVIIGNIFYFIERRRKI